MVTDVQEIVPSHVKNWYAKRKYGKPMLVATMEKLSAFNSKLPPARLVVNVERNVGMSAGVFVGIPVQIIHVNTL